ncbi:type IV pilus modification protein PilV [Marinobacter xestospongiae]|uniref:type IV pilus modification protein PilV n=1 Tax=Marinobacter xestospongiae TaxID=994319 RepID=UPI00200681D9|nr:type IV pilus modification protein PilV [Marinobacter xestospongiae]MCK7568851.1 type IV pilus modification protein PilV [Marinobacter xestospongiae]
MPFRRERGLTLIEILVTVVILAVGLLGVASLTMGGLKNNQSAFLRTQATLLASDMADRMRLNSAEAIAGSYDGFSTKSVPSAPSCGGAGCTASERVDADKVEWAQLVNGANGGMAMLPGGEGIIAGGGGATTAGNTFTITILWAESQWDEANGEVQTINQQSTFEFTL